MIKRHLQQQLDTNDDNNDNDDNNKGLKQTKSPDKRSSANDDYNTLTMTMTKL